jgi:2-oxoglutarate/2-oxoacid ferredoxin oxidoreductase subunit beta
MRRGVNMTYIVENNGVYGLTKGQFSATADMGSRSKRGVANNDSPIDLVGLALQLGATFVARSFSGDKEQLIPLIKGALRHNGAAFIDVISPCVTFNNHAGSTKSYEYVRDHDMPVNTVEVMLPRTPITASYPPGGMREVVQHDGTVLRLRKLAEDYDPTDRLGAMSHLQQQQAKGELVTGLLYVESNARDMHEHLQTVAAPLNRLGTADLCPGRSALEAFNQAHR